MRYLPFLLTGVLLWVGCTSKDERRFLETYNTNKNYHVNLKKTEKTELKDGNYTKALLTATYLFEPVKDKNDTRVEQFIVGLYVDGEEQSFMNGEYNLTLEGEAPQKVKTLAHNDPKLKNISFVLEWTQFYLFTFPHTKKKSFNLIFESPLYGKGTLHFAKVAKYVLTKKPF